MAIFFIYVALTYIPEEELTDRLCRFHSFAHVQKKERKKTDNPREGWHVRLVHEKRANSFCSVVACPLLSKAGLLAKPADTLRGRSFELW